MMGIITFIHPDLGIGGAERAVIDAALALKSRGHSVQFITSHHDLSHCFQETKDGTLKVSVVGDWLPRTIFGKFHALCAYLRMIVAAIYFVISGPKSDVIFVDQISACIPVLKLASAKVIFYCHFPDMLLTQRKSILKTIYRAPIDFIEEKTTGLADLILVNSKFTADIFHKTFTSLVQVKPEVLYPIPDFFNFDKPVDPISADLLPLKAKDFLLSINRYERKKNLTLAINAFDTLLKKNPSLEVHLVMAGGYDSRVVENVEHFNELVSLAKKLGLEERITFLRSFSDSEKLSLLTNSLCLIYTPEHEHFGIVPIEAMYMKCPVIAMKSGGPLETVEHDVTGFLCKNDPDDVASAMYKFVENKFLAKSFGEAGRERVKKQFSFITFTEKLDSIVHGLIVE
ncbi:alpha-1 3/1 6-mannosyltransferase ALG2 [Biomphalaria pfeifferi]|uniref:Alpha-1,3/1,6-mannosyltransferase ALG2 n=1 Tax=Biomphalaria pfeifferi TaxID=112525 RepID=A0AAD8CB77_BIOPF|nr:alpha-1 3/1 6-mannosyltransferase ALG2 [Biomphalaria pfeifferi]